MTFIQYVFCYYVYTGTQSHLGSDFVRCAPAEAYGEDDPPCSENTVIYLFTCMQYLVCCLCFSKGKPFRKEFYTNPFFLVSVVAMLVYQCHLIVN